MILNCSLPLVAIPRTSPGCPDTEPDVTKKPVFLSPVNVIEGAAAVPEPKTPVLKSAVIPETVVLLIFTNKPLAPVTVSNKPLVPVVVTKCPLVALTTSPVIVPLA